MVKSTEEGGRVLVIVAVVPTTEPFGKVVESSVTNVVVGVVSIKVGVVIGGSDVVGGVVIGRSRWVVVEHDVLKSVAVATVWGTSTVTVTGTCTVLTAPAICLDHHL